MEIRNHSTSMVLTDSLQKALAEVRKHRDFNIEQVVEAKVKKLNDYFRNFGLKSAVVAVSGGIDSAVVLGLVELASRDPDSPIERIVAVTLPAPTSQGVTGQELARDLAYEVCEAFGVERYRIYMDSIVNAIIEQVEGQVGKPNADKADWARGQVVSYARTPAYYYVTSVLAAQGQPGAVVGTTNLSEGGYLGYFGKASDGMVDIQLISDLYKSEVYAVGAFLGVPESVMQRAPTGDMFDACTDEVVFGAPYDFVELWMEYKSGGMELAAAVDQLVQSSEESVKQWSEYETNIKQMHRYNGHKYMGKSPAVHLDVLDLKVLDVDDKGSKFPNDWDYFVWGDLITMEPNHD